jgi:hypothetical protein
VLSLRSCSIEGFRYQPREEIHEKEARRSLVTGIALASALGASPAVAVTMCKPTGFIRDNMNLTAAVIADGDISGQTIDASAMPPTRPVPCNIGIYYGPGTSGTVEGSYVYGANYFGIVVTGEDGDVDLGQCLGHLGATSVDVTNSHIHNIGDQPLFTGNQHGVGVYYRAFCDGASATGAISGNTVSLYQKGGVVANGPNTGVSISGNAVTGRGPIPDIAQNGLQIGFGGDGMIMRNQVTGHSYTGPGGVSSAGILIFGGCGSDLTTGVRIVKNVVGSSNKPDGNDMGVALANYDQFCATAPTTATNNKAINNTITNTELTNTSGQGTVVMGGYQAGVYVSGNNDKVINNDISGAGYDPNGCHPLMHPETCSVDDSSGLLVKNHANSFGP